MKSAVILSLLFVVPLVALFRPEGKGEFRIAATGEPPAPGDDEISLQRYHGPADAEHWIRFDNFRIVKLGD
jgi:hypothetical protein